MAATSICRVCSLLAAGGLAACGTGGPRGQSGHINTGLAGATPSAAPGAPTAKTPPSPAWAQDTSVDVQAVVDRMSQEPVDTVFPKNFGINEPLQPPTPPITDKNGPTTLPASDGSTVTVTVNPLKPDAGVDTVINGQPAGDKPLTQRIDDAAVSLIDLLAQQCLTGDMPWKNYLALAALDALHPGAMPKVITPDQKEGGPLSADDRQAVESLREFFSGVAAIPADTSPDARADRMAELADRLLESRPMQIRTPVLCSRVAGYGQFTPLPGSRFQQGVPIHAIVYAEITRFGHRPIGETSQTGNPGDRWTVELTQTLQLFHDADGSMAWSRPEERIIENSRNKRKDFFLIHEITLPATLTIGAYRLKVIMKDKTTGHQDEAIIPLEIVADAQAAAGN